MARPLEVAVEASNGASDYGNKFGEPVLAGFARSFGMLLNGEERREWVKPIMFSGGMGSLEEGHITKDTPEKGETTISPFLVEATVVLGQLPTGGQFPTG